MFGVRFAPSTPPHRAAPGHSLSKDNYRLDRTFYGVRPGTFQKKGRDFLIDALKARVFMVITAGACGGSANGNTRSLKGRSDRFQLNMYLV